MTSNLSRALIIVDVQPTFCERGELAVEGGNDTAQRIADYVTAKGGCYDFIATTQDWHIEPGDHFSSTPDFVDTWPPHGLAGSSHAQLHPAIAALDIQHHFKKGQYAAAYSGFEGVELAEDLDVPTREQVTQAWQQHRTLASALQSRQISDVDVVGIALSHCVKETALDANKLGYQVRVLSNLTVPVSEELGVEACHEMLAAGITIEPWVVDVPDRAVDGGVNVANAANAAISPDDSTNAEILDESLVPSHYNDGSPVPVTIPIALAPGVSVVYTTRLGGSSHGDFASLNLGGKGGDDLLDVVANRTALSQELGRELSIISQVHSGTAIDIDKVWTRNTPYGFDASGSTTSSQSQAHADDVAQDVQVFAIAADGQVSLSQQLAIGMFAADCLPVLLADPVTGVIAAAHCGRMGLLRGIIGETVDLMVARGADRQRIVATCGPCICGDCYEVGDEIATDFEKHFPGTRTITRFGGPGVDIAGAALQELQRSGVNNIVSSQPRVDAATQYLNADEELRTICDADGGEQLDERLAQMKHSLCTLENPLWFSHRASALHHKEHEGRMLALIMRT